MDKWQINAFVLITLTLTHFALSDTIRSIDGDDLLGPNVCKRVTSYNVSVTVQVMVPYTEIKKEWCAAFPPRCSKSVVRMKAENRTEIHQNTKAIRECCDGYKENPQKNGCIPHCQKPCNNGKCVEPNVCKCDNGYGGKTCDVHCPPGYYGQKCKKKCDCANDATCDPYDGVCHCQKGYQGTKCEQTCTPDFFGEGCLEICRCKNGGKCNHVSGECYCQEGFTGPLCEEQCTPGNVNCKTICRCQNGGICDEDKETCKCPPGWTGKVCANRCQPGFYGANCSQICECFNGASCNHITGNCICEPGFMGAKCLDQCPYDKYGTNCTQQCDCANGGACDRVNGNCECTPGWKGLDCTERKCPEQFYGEKCDNECECKSENTLSCHPFDGSCICKPGWSSATCNRPCPFLTYGDQCNQKCDCRNNAQCLPTNGTCVCPIGYTGEKCEEKCPNGTYGQDCAQRCECKNGADCKEDTGQCFCKPGWGGFHCERPCDSGFYGQDCKEKCDCLNSGSCNPISGECYCAPGWFGPKCETKCEDWKFGQNCTFDCLCKKDNTLACDHKTGQCFCKTEFRASQTIKYSGVQCESLCPLGYYGRECHHQCYCKNNSSCDPDSGECFCDRGWHGKTCDQKCPNGYFGLGCKEKCPENMPPQTTCDHVTGETKCRSGYVGLTCEHPCKAGTYGEDCKHECKCENGGECSHIDGICHCLPGWTGEHCETHCSDGTWGIKCGHTCSCANGARCRPSDGQCICKPGFMEPKCEEVCPEGYYGRQCVEPCNCNRKGNFICHPANGCVCKNGYGGSNCEYRLADGSVEGQPENNQTFASTTIETILITPSEFSKDAQTSHSAFTTTSEHSILTTSSTPFTFVPLDATVNTKIYDHKSIEVSSSSTPFTFLPLDSTTTTTIMKSFDDSPKVTNEPHKSDKDVTMTQFVTDTAFTLTTSVIYTEANATAINETKDIPSTTMSAQVYDKNTFSTGSVDKEASEDLQSTFASTTSLPDSLKFDTDLNTTLSSLESHSTPSDGESSNTPSSDLGGLQNDDRIHNKTSFSESITTTTFPKSNNFLFYLLINAIKFSKPNSSEENSTMESMEQKKDEIKGFPGNQAGLIWGMFCTLLFIAIIGMLLLYYRRRVANLKAEIGHVVRYMSDDPRNFDNPVYSYQASSSINTDTSTLLNRNGQMNGNFRPSRPLNMPLNNFDDPTNSSGRAAAYSLQYDPELMNQKNHEADLTNPNLYCSIDDHLYDEIKLKCAELDEEYDHLNYSRPLQPVVPHYHRATSSSMPSNSPPDRGSQQSNNRFPSHTDIYDAPIPHPKKLNISVPVPPLPDRGRYMSSNLTPSPSSSTASTVTQDDNIDAIISVEKPMNKDLSGGDKPEELVMNSQQTDENNKLEC